MSDLEKPVSPIAPYQEHHFNIGIEDVGVAFNNDRIWVCVNGVALLRARVIGDKFFVSYTPENLLQLLNNRS